MSNAQISLPPKMAYLFSKQRGDVIWRIARGGRGSGKSQSFAKMSAIFGYTEKLRIACLRDFQNSIKESFYAEVKAAIQKEKFLIGLINLI